MFKKKQTDTKLEVEIKQGSWGETKSTLERIIWGRWRREWWSGGCIECLRVTEFDNQTLRQMKNGVKDIVVTTLEGKVRSTRNAARLADSCLSSSGIREEENDHLGGL